MSRYRFLKNSCACLMIFVFISSAAHAQKLTSKPSSAPLATAPSPSAESRAGGKVGFLLSTHQEERYKEDILFVTTEAKKAGLELITEVSNNDPKVERERFESLLSKGVEVILFQATDPEHVQDLIEMAHKERVAVIAYDREIRSAQVDGAIIHDSKEIGALQARSALEASHENLSVLILAGPTGQPVADDIAAGAEEVLKGQARVKSVEVTRIDLWSPTRALASVRVALQKKSLRPNIILAGNSSMALAALQAVKDWKEQSGNHGKATFFYIAGADADLSSLQALAKGQIQFEVLKDFRDLARRAIEMSRRMIKEIANREGAFKIKPERVVLPVYGLDSKNLAQVIRQTRKFSHAEVFGTDN